LFTYLVFSFLALLSFVAAMLPQGWLVLGVFLIIGFAALGVFPMYYAFGQELSSKHQGKVTGSLGFICWVVMAGVHEMVGRMTKMPELGYRPTAALIGVAPLIGLLALVLFWKVPRPVPAPATAPGEPDHATEREPVAAASS